MPKPDTRSVFVFAIHTDRPDQVGAVEVVFLDELEARAYAQDRSTDHRVCSASVTRYEVGQLGSRHPLALYVDGRQQDRPDRYPGRLYPAC